MSNLSGFAKAHLAMLVGGIVGLFLMYVFGNKVAITVGATYWLSAWAVLGLFHVVYSVVKSVGNKQKNNF